VRFSHSSQTLPNPDSCLIFSFFEFTFIPAFWQENTREFIAINQCFFVQTDLDNYVLDVCSSVMNFCGAFSLYTFQEYLFNSLYCFFTGTLQKTEGLFFT
jgi:hypothetical protein